MLTGAESLSNVSRETWWAGLPLEDDAIPADPAPKAIGVWRSAQRVISQL
jgi:hypothetical protein